ncbi:two-component response regulator DpiA, partial [Escherichia coli]|uniref:two-component response regulator DpiA n=1 Tax=Escherichia coli TaxID=562 RepID=UPI002036FB67
MTAPLTLLIVEDETPLAEMHAEYIRHIPGFSQILLAGNLAQARMMIERFKPGLILLDNYLPDGRGINLLHELVQAHYPGDVVFTTAASDMETVSEAVRCGVFDYLIKPIAYERLGQTLTRFDAPRDKCTLSCAINGIHAAFHYLKKNYISGCVMTVPTGW